MAVSVAPGGPLASTVSPVGPAAYAVAPRDQAIGTAAAGAMSKGASIQRLAP